MPLSTRMNWTIPAENADPWYDRFSALVNEMDQAAYATREDRNLILMGGGDISWTLSISTLAWTEPIRVFSPVTGLQCIIAAGSVVLDQDGKLFHAPLVRFPTGANKTIVTAVASQVPTATDPNAQLLFALRWNDLIHWRNGLVMQDGDVVTNFRPEFGGSFIAAGDLSGDETSQTVVGIRGNPVAVTAPTVGQVYKWSGTEWVPSGGGITTTFVYRPGGVAGDNVYTDWSLLMTALAAVEGPRIIEFDDTGAGINIPAGTHELEKNVVLRGRWRGPSNQVILNMLDGAVFLDAGLLENVAIFSESASPVFDFTSWGDGSSALYLKNSVLSTYTWNNPPASELILVPDFGSFDLYVENSKLQVPPATGSPEAIVVTSAVSASASVYLSGSSEVGNPYYGGTSDAAGNALSPGGTSSPIAAHIYGEGVYWDHGAPTGLSKNVFGNRRKVVAVTKDTVTNATVVPVPCGAAYLSFKDIPKQPNVRCFFRVIIETTNAAAGQEAYIDLYDVHGQLNAGTPVVVPGSMINTGTGIAPAGAPTPNPLVPSLYEVELTSAIVGGTWVSDIAIFEARVWIGTASGNAATAKSAELIFEW